VLSADTNVTPTLFDAADRSALKTDDNRQAAAPVRTEKEQPPEPIAVPRPFETESDVRESSPGLDLIALRQAIEGEFLRRDLLSDTTDYAAMLGLAVTGLAIEEFRTRQERRSPESEDEPEPRPLTIEELPS
jgi:hypothetical protein